MHFSDIVLGLIVPHQAGKDGKLRGEINVTVTSVEEADKMKRKEKWKKEKEVLYLAWMPCSSLDFVSWSIGVWFVQTTQVLVVG